MRRDCFWSSSENTGRVWRAGRFGDMQRCKSIICEVEVKGNICEEQEKKLALLRCMCLRNSLTHTEASFINCTAHRAPCSSSYLNRMNRFYLSLAGCNFFCNTWREGGKKWRSQGEGWCVLINSWSEEQLVLGSH